MRHRKASLKLNRTTSHRMAMFRNMVTSLFKHERIRTTNAKAKELRRWADHLITLAKRGDLHARRQALAIVREKQVVHKLFAEAGEKFGHSDGGYTRVVKIGRRTGDAAPMSIIELVVPEAKGKKSKKKASKKGTSKAKSAATKKTGVEGKGEQKPQESKAKKTETKKKSGGKKKTETAKSEEGTKDKSAAKTKATTAKKEKTSKAKPKGASKKKTAKDEK